ncbi:MAG: DUF4440 domain-containing protein [Chloroflexi bacterium]|nr:DUF4440 domain-containing protein [Chloroflexota bacterium]
MSATPSLPSIGAFAAGDADALAELFAADAQLLLLYREPIENRAAIREQWAQGFARHDTSAWRTEWRIVDVHGDNAYALAFYTETLVPWHGDEDSLLVNGRVILFLRRDADGPWRVSLAMNSHRRPTEPQAPDDGAISSSLADQVP